MSRAKPLVIVTRRLPEPVETRMRELFQTRLNIDDRPMTQAELVEAMKAADVLVPTVTDRIDGEMIAQAGERLKLIANFGNGVDNIDVDAAVKRGITVTNTPNVLTEDTADMTMALILSVPRRLAEGARILREGQKWSGWSPTWMLGHRIWGKRLGIVGMGRIGTAVARRARAFGLAIHYHNRRPVGRQDRGGARGDLLGQPRPDAGARRHRLGELPGDARHLSPPVAPPPEADAPRRRHREHGARLHHRRGGADRVPGDRTRSPAPASTSSSTSRRSTRSS